LAGVQWLSFSRHQTGPDLDFFLNIVIQEHAACHNLLQNVQSLLWNYAFVIFYWIFGQGDFFGFNPHVYWHFDPLPPQAEVC
jgi:hypothetical protein